MSKDPTPRADELRKQREARYGHLQATAAPAKPKLIPYAGKPKDGTGTRGPRPPVDQSPEAKAARKRIKYKRKTVL